MRDSAARPAAHHCSRGRSWVGRPYLGHRRGHSSGEFTAALLRLRRGGGPEPAGGPGEDQQHDDNGPDPRTTRGLSLELIGSLWSCSRLTRTRLLELLRIAPTARHSDSCSSSLCVKKARDLPFSSAGAPHYGNGVLRKLPLRVQADHSTARAPPRQGTAGYAPLPPRGARAYRGSVLPMLAQAHLLRFPIWQGRWPANRSASVALVSWRPCMQYGMRKSPPPLGTGRHVDRAVSDLASQRVKCAKLLGSMYSKSNVTCSYFFEILSL